MRKFLLIIFLTFNFPSFSQVGIQTSFEYGYFTSKNVDVKQNLYHPYIGINYKNKISADFLIIPNLSYAPGFRDTFKPYNYSQNINLGFDLNYFPGYTYSDEESLTGIYFYINPSLRYIFGLGTDIDSNFKLKIKYGFGYDTGKVQYAVFYGNQLGKSIVTLNEIGIKIAFYINKEFNL